MATATGLGGIGAMSVFEQPHTGGNYLMHEMIHVVGRKHAAKLRGIAIALAVAQESQAARVIGTDVSRGAIDVAEMNARTVLRREYARTAFLRGNLLDPLGDQHVDVVLSNPPYQVGSTGP